MVQAKKWIRRQFHGAFWGTIKILICYKGNLKYTLWQSQFMPPTYVYFYGRRLKRSEAQRNWWNTRHLALSPFF